MGDAQHDGSGDTASNNENVPPRPPPPPQGGINNFLQHATTHKLDMAQWGTRLATILFTLGYFLPLFGNPYNAYYKALMANAATNALRLHQRMPPVRFSREYFSMLILEDSCHYLFYSLIFLYAGSMTLVLMPIFLFALLHAASYSLTLLDTLGQSNTWWGARLLITLVEFQSRTLLRMVAITEIFLMPFTGFMIFFGRSTLITPFVYYRFLVLRYASRRNPHTRNMFHELRLGIEMTINKPSCPLAIRNISMKAIDFICRLAPPTVHTATTQQ